MKKTLMMITLTAVLALIIAPANSAELTSIAELEKLVQANFSKVKTLSTDFKQHMTMAKQGSITIEGKMNFLMPNKMNVHFDSTMMGQDMKTLVVNDGTYIWTQVSMGTNLTQVFKTELAEVLKLKRLTSAPGVSAQDMDVDQFLFPLNKLKETYDLTWLGKKQLDTETFYCVEAIITATGTEKLKGLGQSGQLTEAMAGHQKYYFDQDKGLLRKMVFFSKENTETISMEFSNQVINPELDPASFTYTAPKDVKVLDMTFMVKQMIESMTGQKGEATAEEPAQPDDDNQVSAPK